MPLRLYAVRQPRLQDDEQKCGAWRPGKLMTLSEEARCWKDSWEKWGHP